jgi:hypothetical protein
MKKIICRNARYVAFSAFFVFILVLQMVFLVGIKGPLADWDIKTLEPGFRKLLP